MELSEGVIQYGERLAALGIPDREVARAMLYAHCYGLESLSGVGCVTFDLPPMCGNDDCLAPDHQRVSR